MLSTLAKRLIALVVAVIVVHLIYIGVILPGAESALEIARDHGQSAPRDLFIILKDIEQEICIILMAWGIYLISEKVLAIIKDKYLFEEDLLTITEAMDGDGDKMKAAGKAREYLEQLPAEIRRAPLVRMLRLSLGRFLITRDVHSTSESIDSNIDALMTSIEADNSMIRYLIWAIPSIGFIGTVRGIGQALSQADQALAGNIAGMTGSLGLAFNSTFVALIISILLMFLLHQLQRMQDSLVVDIRAYCEKHLMEHISR